MRNLKRVLSLALALVMMLGMMVIGANAASTDFGDAAEIDYTEAVDVLTGLGVLEGDDLGNFNAKDILTREQAAKILCYVMLGKTNAEKLGKNTEIFKDVPAGRWSAGFIAYCSNVGLIAGNGDGTFDPTGELTGVAFAKLLLVAAGYDAEYEGYVNDKDWATNIAVDAIDAGIDVKGVALADALTREQAAQMVLQALDMKTVEYLKGNVIGTVGAFETTTTFMAKYFPGLEKNGGVDDKWGRPADHGWAYKGVQICNVMETPKATYTTAVNECKIASDVGLKTEKAYSLYTNGAVNKTTYKVQPLDTVQTLGAQGTLTEVYADRIVVIDTVLAAVTDVKDATYDAAGHLRTPSMITLKAYTTATDNAATGTAMVLTNGTTNYTYAKGDMVLVNAYTTNSVNYTTGDVTVTDVATTTKNVANVAGYTSQPVANYAEILGLSTSVVGAQTFLWYNAKQHTVDGTNYNDAKWFKLDQAGTAVTNHTWFFDSYGNLIGVKDIATQYTYGIVESIQWINPTMATGYAQATIRYMDGNTDLKVVASIDAQPLTYAGTTENGDFSAGKISTTWQNNAAQCGNDLYRIETNPNGTLTLKHVFTLSGSTEIKSELTTATIKTGVSAVTGTSGTIYTNSNTVYMVKSVVGSTVSYNMVTGYENMANYTGTAKVDWVNLNGDSYVDYVFVTGTPDSAQSWSMMFPTSATVQTVLAANGGVDHYLVTGYVDGVAASIKVAPTTLINGTGSAVTAADLAGLMNKMYAVHFTNGKVDAIWGAKVTTNDLYTEVGSAASYANTAMIVYGGSGSTVTYDGQALQIGPYAPINVVGVTPVVGTWAADLSNKVVHVIYNKNTTKAVGVYITDPAESGTGSGSGVVSDGTIVRTLNIVNKDTGAIIASYSDTVTVTGGTSITYLTNGLASIFGVSTTNLVPFGTNSVTVAPAAGATVYATLSAYYAG